MARMPTRDDLPQATPSAGAGPVRQARNTIGRDIAVAGNVVARQMKADREKTSALELARARSQWQTSLLAGKDSYNLRNKPEYIRWGDDFEKGSDQWQKEAAKNITDPQVREQFILETDDDRVHSVTSVREEARKIGNADQLLKAKTSIDQMTVNASRTDLSEPEREAAWSDVGETIKGLVDSGVVTKAKATEMMAEIRQKSAGLMVEQDIHNKPIAAHQGLTGGVNDNFKKKVRRRESRGNDKAKSTDSSARGRYQFVDRTWLGLMRDYPGLGLTADGRDDPEQQERAMDKLIELNADALDKAEQPITEASLYVTHFMGAPEGIEMLAADPAADAAEMFPKAAAANRKIFYTKDGNPRNVGTVLKNLTKGMSQQHAPAPAYYADLSAEDRTRLTRIAEKAAEIELADIDKEARIDESRTLVDYATSNFSSRTEAANYIKRNASDPALREDALSALDGEYRRIDQAEDAARKEQWENTFNTVQELIELDRLDEARKAIPSSMPGEDRRKLRALIDKGPATVNKSEVLRELQAMKMTDPAAFADLDLTKYQTDLTQATISGFHADQQALKKDDTKHTSLQTANSMLNDEMRAMGIVTGAKATEMDVRYAQRVRSLVAPEIERRETAKGKPLTTSEMQQVIDDVFVEFRADRPGWIMSGEENVNFKDVMSDFNEVEDDNDMVPGSLMDQALKDARRSNPNITPTSQELYMWLQNYKNRAQTQ